mmetsp:Transcript_18826/g.40879  ORF Transcript_18826/g.40879 Transcript_18826/m.40879 type:complete len:220 (-) Transcript_18826:97-756(-)
MDMLKSRPSDCQRRSMMFIICNVRASCRRSSPTLCITITGPPSSCAFSNTTHRGNFLESMYLHFCTRIPLASILGLRGSWNVFGSVICSSLSLSTLNRSSLSSNLINIAASLSCVNTWFCLKSSRRNEFSVELLRYASSMAPYRSLTSPRCNSLFSAQNTVWPTLGSCMARLTRKRERGESWWASCFKLCTTWSMWSVSTVSGSSSMQLTASSRTTGSG